MAKNKRYQNVSDLMADVLPEDPDFADELKEQINKRRLVRGLATFRNIKDVSQADVAKIAKCGQSRISKLENGFDSDLSIGDLEAYAEALGCNVQVELRDRDFTIVDEVKLHAFRMKRCFDRMAELAKKDDVVAQGVANFFAEAIPNLVSIVMKSAENLPKQKSRRIQLNVPELELSQEKQLSKSM